MLNNDKLIVLGTGFSSLEYKNTGDKILAFQEAFPNCVDKLNVIPDYWFSADPNSFISGFQYLINNHKNESFKKIKILIPSFFTKDLNYYRMFCGTTPIMRVPNGWNLFQILLKNVSKYFTIQVLPATTTKFIKLFDSENFNCENLFDENCKEERFKKDKIVFGTVEFDSESVIGDKFKWGLENKLTSSVLPLCYFLQFKLIEIYGFDFIGPRFYSDIERHPWNDESQETDSVVNFSLSLLQKWKKWESLHDMKLLSGVSSQKSLLNKILDYKDQD